VKGRRLFLIRIYKDLRVQKILQRPITLAWFDEKRGLIDVELIEKTAILCDACNDRVAVTEEEVEEFPIGYALCDKEYLLEVVCEDCRRKHFKDLRVYDNLEEALGGC